MGSAVFRLATRVALALLFAFFGTDLLTGGDEVVADYHLATYPDWMAELLGVLEISAGAALLIPKATRYAVAVLFPIMSGAVWTVLQSDKRTAEADIYLPVVLAALLLSLLITPAKGGRVPVTPRVAPPQRPQARTKPREVPARGGMRPLGPFARPSGSLPIRGPSSRP